MATLTILYGQPEDPAAFEDYYANRHLPWASETMPDVQGAQLLRVLGTAGGEPPLYYRIAEMTWADQDALQAALASEEGKAVLADHEQLRHRRRCPAHRTGGSALMTLRLEHLLIPARDQERSAHFLADLLGLQVTRDSSGSSAAHFAVVRVEDITIDFATIEQFDPHHLAFAVDDETFDTILDRISAADLQYSADPTHQRPGELNDNNSGRGLYVHDPDGHNLEFLTRPITA